MLFLALVTGCRGDKPPAVPICTADGFGGADCNFLGVSQDIAPSPWPGTPVGSDPAIRYLKPSETKNFYMTTQAGMKWFAAWCYDTTPEAAEKALSLSK